MPFSSMDSTLLFIEFRVAKRILHNADALLKISSSVNQTENIGPDRSIALGNQKIEYEKFLLHTYFSTVEQRCC